MEFDLLNDDSLLYLFSFLSLGDQLTARAVCRRWYHLIDNRLARHVARIGRNSCDWSECGEPDHCISSSESLDVKDADKIVPIYRIVDLVLLKSSRIRVLILPRMAFREGDLTDLFIQSPNLNHVDLSFSTGITESDLSTLGLVCGHCLTHVNLRGADVRENGIREMVSEAPFLEYLATSGDGVTGRYLHHSPLIYLKHLELGGFNVDERLFRELRPADKRNLRTLVLGPVHITPRMIEAIATRLRDVKCLTFRRCSFNFDTELSHIGIRFGGLECFRFIGHEHLNFLDRIDIEVQMIAEHNPGLRVFQLSGRVINYETLGYLAESCPNMELLSIHLLVRPSDEAISVVTTLDSLIFLDLGNTKLSESHLISIISGCPSLEHIRCNTNNVSDATLLAILDLARDNPQKRFKFELNIRHLPTISDYVKSLMPANVIFRHYEGYDYDMEKHFYRYQFPY